jgi:hypothetical protein
VEIIITPTTMGSKLRDVGKASDRAHMEEMVISVIMTTPLIIIMDKEAQCWWLTPVILDAQEAEIRRIMVQGQSGQIVCETPS